MSWDDEDAPARPLWLITFADLALLLLGFFVLIQATQRLDPAALAAGIRSGFGMQEVGAPAQTPAMPVDLAVVDGFTPGSPLPPEARNALAWAREAARDPRTQLRITGEVDGSAADVDPVTGSGPILAADRARAVAAMLVRHGGVSPNRIAISTSKGTRRRAVLSLGYDGGRQ
jgi:flagellar motor protein MotB